jgi:hypothetical protein
MRRIFSTALVLFALASSAASAQEFSTLEERMSAKEFKAAGLDKLSPEELAALNAWLSKKVSTTGAVPAATPVADDRGFLTSTDDEGAIHSSIDGEFRGWSGRGDRITLSNGQVWEVVDSTSRLKIRVDNPEVTIEPGAFNSWSLRVSGYNTRAKVRRIK